MRDGVVENIYRKRGRVARLENGTLLDIAERGVAYERDGTFFCAPDAEREHLPRIDPQRVLAAADELRLAVPREVRIERLIVSEGVAEHAIGETTWHEHVERVHLALSAGVLRVLVDLGSFDLRDARVSAEALAGSEQLSRTAPERVRLAPGVAAALLPHLVGVRRADVEIVQTAGGVDGMGKPIEEARVDGAPAPNWYRPSYRVRPMRLAINVRAVGSSSSVDHDAPVALALLDSAAGSRLRVLVDDGRSVYPSAIPDRPIVAVAGERIWYPYAAGSFGAEMML